MIQRLPVRHFMMNKYSESVLFYLQPMSVRRSMNVFLCVLRKNGKGTYGMAYSLARTEWSMLSVVDGIILIAQVFWGYPLPWMTSFFSRSKTYFLYLLLNYCLFIAPSFTRD